MRVLTLNPLWSAGALAGLTWVLVFCPFGFGRRSASGELPFSFCYSGPDSEPLLLRWHSGVTEAVVCARQTLAREQPPRGPGTESRCGQLVAADPWPTVPGRRDRILHSGPSLSTATFSFILEVVCLRCWHSANQCL